MYDSTHMRSQTSSEVEAELQSMGCRRSRIRRRAAAWIELCWCTSTREFFKLSVHMKYAKLGCLYHTSYTQSHKTVARRWSSVPVRVRCAMPVDISEIAFMYSLSGESRDASASPLWEDTSAHDDTAFNNRRDSRHM